MAKSTRPAPSAEDIRALASELEELHREADDQIKLTRKTREMRDDIIIEERYTDAEFRDPTLTDECFRVPASLTLNPPKWTITNDDPDPNAGRNTTLRERWTAQTFQVCGAREGPPSTHARLVDACCVDGGAYAKLAWNKDVWVDAGGLRRQGRNESSDDYNRSIDAKRKEAGPPFLFQSADPLTVYPWRSGGKLSTLIEMGEAPFLSTLRQNGLTYGRGDGGKYRFEIGPLQAKDSGLPKVVKTYGYWDEEWHCYLIDAPDFEPYMVTSPFEHGYGRVPFFHAPGLMMNHWYNRKVGWGVGQTKSFLIRYMNLLGSQLADKAAVDIYSPTIHQIDPEHGIPLDRQGNRKTRDERIGLREVLLSYGPNDRWLPFPVTDAAPALREMMALVRQMIESTLTPKVTSQIGGGLEGAGFAINQVLAEAAIQDHPYIENLGAMYVEMTRFAWELIGRKLGAKDKVWVFLPGDKAAKTKGGYLGLSKADLKDAVEIEVDIDPERPTAKLIEGRYHVEQVQAGFESPKQAIEAQGRNYDEVQDGLVEARVRKEPWFVEYEDDQMRYAMGLGRLKVLAQQAQQVAQTGVPPAMGSAEVPDMGSLAAAPNQAAPDNAGGPGALPGNGNLGGSPGAVVPTQSAAPGAQALAA